VDELGLGSFAEVTGTIHQRPIKDDAVAGVFGNQRGKSRLCDSPNRSIGCCEDIHLHPRFTKIVEPPKVLRTGVAYDLKHDGRQRRRLRAINPVNACPDKRSHGRRGSQPRTQCTLHVQRLDPRSHFPLGNTRRGFSYFSPQMVFDVIQRLLCPGVPREAHEPESRRVDCPELVEAGVI
jgi:hypothetical protein